MSAIYKVCTKDVTYTESSRMTYNIVAINCSVTLVDLHQCNINIIAQNASVHASTIGNSIINMSGTAAIVEMESVDESHISLYGHIEKLFLKIYRSSVSCFEDSCIHSLTVKFTIKSDMNFNRVDKCDIYHVKHSTLEFNNENSAMICESLMDLFCCEIFMSCFMIVENDIQLRFMFCNVNMDKGFIYTGNLVISLKQSSIVTDMESPFSGSPDIVYAYKYDPCEYTLFYKCANLNTEYEHKNNVRNL